MEGIMNILRELQDRISNYLEGKEEFSALRDWFAPLVIDIDSCDDPQVMRAFYSMQRSISDFSEGFLSEEQLKQNVSVLLIPSSSSYVFVDVAKAGVIAGTATNVVVGTASVGVGPALVFV
jgi:hypothetical protein